MNHEIAINFEGLPDLVNWREIGNSCCCEITVVNYEMINWLDDQIGQKSIDINSII